MPVHFARTDMAERLGASPRPRLLAGLAGEIGTEFTERPRYAFTVFSGLSAIALLTAAVHYGWLDSLDRSLMTGSTGPQWDLVGTLLNAVTPITRWFAHGAICLLSVVLFAARGYRQRSAGLAGAAIASGAVLYVMQLVMSHAAGQTRPTAFPPELSFPSGHALSGFTVFGFATFLMWHHGLDVRLRLPLTGLTALLALASGAARVYFVMHWPSDVAGAFLLGVVGLAVAIPVYVGVVRGLERETAATCDLVSSVHRYLDGGVDGCSRPNDL